MFRILFIFVLLSSCRSLIWHESASDIYDITIVRTPIKNSQIKESHIEVVSKHGQQFICNIPSPILKPTQINSTGSFTGSAVANVFSSWNLSNCILWNAGWWTYEVCIGSHINQYHDVNGVAAEISSLGIFDNEFDWTQSTPYDAQVMEKYHSQFYSKGTICDLTNLPRTTELRFVCHDGATSPNILEVSEVETCRYIIRVASADFCNIAALAQKIPVKPGSITCSPLVSDNGFSKYEEAQSKKITASEDKKFAEMVSKLTLTKKQAAEAILSHSRSYQNRMQLDASRHMRRIRRQTLDLLRLIELNFQPKQNVKAEEILACPDFRQSCSIHDSHNALEPVDIGRLIMEFETLIQPPSRQESESIRIQNATLSISLSLLSHIRRSFELCIANNVHPRTVHMLAGAVNVMRKLTSLESNQAERILSSIRKHQPLWMSSKPDFQPQFMFTFERTALNTLNATTVLKAKLLAYSELRSFVSNLLRNKFDISTDADDLFLSDVQSAERQLMLDDEDSELDVARGGPDGEERLPSGLMRKGLSHLSEVLMSSKMQDTLKQITSSNPSKGVKMKTDLKRVGDGTYAFVITLAGDDESNERHQQNEENYKLKLPYA